MMRPAPEDAKTVACVGAGTIGGGWAAYFLSRGLDVIATDPGDGAEAALRRFVDMAWPQLEQLGLAQGADRARLSFTADLDDAVSAADFIQESVPDWLDLKLDVFARIDAAARPDTIISSSSSEFLPSALAAPCGHPERCIIGHPFVPSYLVPLVEVVGGKDTSDEVLDWAMAFYSHNGKKALRLKNEIEAYIANRLQHAVFKEMFELVEKGICDFSDVDDAMRYGPGMRWAFAGPLLCLHMGGGQGGLDAFIKHFGWSGPPELEAKARAEVDALYGDLAMDEIEAWRDANLLTMQKNVNFTPEGAG